MEPTEAAEDWTRPLVREYFQTAKSGFPYVSCPDKLRPADAAVDSWWVIYAPRLNGGVIIEGYRIDQWRTFQQRLVVFWCLIGLLIYYALAFGQYFGWTVVFVALWILALLPSGYLLGSYFFRDCTWMPFPADLQQALRRERELKETRDSEGRRADRASEGVGKVAGGIAGALMEATAGKAAGKASEIVVEEAFKALARRAFTDQRE